MEAKNGKENFKIWNWNNCYSDFINTVGNHFVSYMSSTGAGTNNPLDGMKEIYAGIPNNKVFEIFSTFNTKLSFLSNLYNATSYQSIYVQ